MPSTEQRIIQRSGPSAQYSVCDTKRQDGEYINTISYYVKRLIVCVNYS